MGPRLRLVVQAVSKNTRFDIQSASRALSYCLIRRLTRLAVPLAAAGGYVYKSGDLAPAEGSTRGGRWCARQTRALILRCARVAGAR